MDDLSEFQQRAAAAGAVKMLSGRHFSICDLEAVAKTIGRESHLSGKDYAALRAIHCVEWADMGPDLARLTREKCLELLGLPPQIVEVVQPVSSREPPSEPAKRLRLAFWRA